jgi:hypothetical protein
MAMEQLDRSLDGVTYLPSSAQAATTHPPAARRRQTTRRPVMTRDVWVYRIVVSAFASVLLIAAFGALLLPLFRVQDSELSSTLLVALTSGSVGALAGLLAPAPHSY